MIERNGTLVRLSGPVTIETVTSLYSQGLQPNGQSALVVDLSGVSAVDSSAVSLLLAWLREAQRNNVSLSFANIPGNLMSLATLYGVADMFPVSTATPA